MILLTGGLEQTIKPGVANLSQDYRTLMQPVLNRLEQAGGELQFAELLKQVAETLNPAGQMQDEPLPSGRESALANSLRWALSYLGAEGRLSTSADGSRVFLRADRGFNESAMPFSPAPPMDYGPGDADDGSGDYALAVQFGRANRQLRHDLLSRIYAQQPVFFEKLIIHLLVAMGYGRDSGRMARRLGGRGDGGVDGVIHQDELGLDYLYIQAKRYKPSTTVPIAAVRDFAGSLEAHKAPKGVFVTTACFPDSARSFVGAIPRRIALVDGSELAELMVRHNIGVRPEPRYTLKQLDSGYFTS